ncbi:MAG: efflux RND transporter permease subunit, partial [Myxococcota bacterium]|nr:efflux RND transporter permease subunit [Myxococcota bacterium]
MFLSRLSVRRPVLMTMVIGVFVVFGIVAFQKMPVELLPPVDLPYVMIQLVYPGASPEDVETAILTPLEEELGRVNNVRTMHTTAVPDGGRVILELEMETDPDVAVEQIRTVLEQIDAELPPAMRAPLVQAVDLRAAPVMSIAVTGDRSAAELTAWAEDHVELPLSRVEGAALVELVGDRQPEAHVDVDQGRLLAHHLTLGHVVEGVRRGGIDLPAGIIEGDGQAIPVRLASAFRSVDDLAAVTLEAPTGERVPLSTVADVSDAVSPELTRARLNGRRCVGVGVYKMADANTVALGRRLRQQLDVIQADVPDDLELTIIYDASGAISTSVNDLALTMVLSILLTASLLYLFLHDLRGTAIVAITIPATIVATLTFVYLAGFSINYMTLMGLAITVGTMVDASIVVLESIARHAQDESDAAVAADKGTGRVMLGVVGSTVTNIAVFTPIAFMKGIAGQFFLQFAMTITFAMVFALFMSFTLTPMLASYLYRRNGPLARLRPGPIARLWERGFTAFRRSYRGVLRWCLGHRAATVAGLV